jgi:hypothetical protein
MTWYQHVVALWDGADHLALIYNPHAEAGGDLYVRTAPEAAGIQQLTAVLPDRTEGQAVHVIRLPENHRFVTVNLALPNADSLLITLDESLNPTSDTERRLVLLHTSADGEPHLDSLSRAAVSRSKVSALLAEGLKIVRDRVDRSNGTVIWGVCCTERRLLPQGVNTRLVHLAISPCEIAYPEAKQDAPIELKPLTLTADAFAEDDHFAAPDPYWPLIAQTVLAEQDRRPHHGIQVRALRGNPFVQWVLRRSAAIHVRRQIRVDEINGPHRQTSVDRLSIPFGNDELAAIGGTPEDPEEHEDIELAVPAEDPAIRAGSLWRLLQNDSRAMAGVRPEQGSMLTNDHASADQTTLWFDGAVLGDHIGVASTQPSVLNVFSGGDTDAEASNVVMFRVTVSGLEPLPVSADEADALITEVAKVQERDLGTDARSDQPSRSLDAARRNLERWSSQQFGGTLQISFVGLEPLLVMGLASLAAAAAERSKSLIDLYRHDPALCGLLVANGADAARLERVALRRPPLGEHLLRRFASANDAANMVTAEGVRPDAEIDALKMLSDPAQRSRLIAARIALDSSTENLREVADTALATLADRGPLVTLAESLRERGRTAEAQRITKHLDDFRTGAWIPLGQASELATDVRAWQAEHEAIVNRIDDISIDVSAETSPGGPRSADEIRKSIDSILENVESRPDLEMSIGKIKQTFDLASLDRKQLVQLENRVLTFVYGPARERLVNEVLGDLEEWAGLREFLSRLSEYGEDPDRVRKRGRREGAVLLINRVETMQPWRVPISASADDTFTGSRIDLHEWIAARKHTDTGSGDQLEQDFRSLVIPIGDLFLHHRAFMALRGLSNSVKVRLIGDSAMRTLDRQLARGLAKWPDGAAETWSTASEMATRIGRAESDRLGASLVPPGSVAE